jgi:glycosyltransferase involved in cell wall biosynthesis
VRILHIDEQTGWRGGEQQASYLIRGLVERGHACAIAGRPGSAFLTADHGVDLLQRFAAPFRGEFDLWSAYRLARAALRLEVDILHAHTSHALTYAVLARQIAGRGKVVASRRVDFPPRPNPFSRWKYRRADHIVAISNKIAQVMREFGVPETQMSVVHSGIDPERFDVAPLPRSELGTPEGVPLLGNVAALVGHKDHATLIAAMPIVLAAFPDAHLVIAGDGPLRADLERRIAELRVGHAVRLLGFRNDIPRLLKALDVFVMSSKEEGLGTSILDAMAAGVPVVATDGGGIPEMVRDGETGLLSPVGDAESLGRSIVRMVEDREFRNRSVAQAAAMVQAEFTWSEMAGGNLRIYQELARANLK